MTTLIRPVPASPSPAASPPQRFARRTLAVGIAVGALALAVALVGLAVDPRVIQGAPAWLKPMKFGVSIVLYVATLRWIVGVLPGHRRLLNVAAVVIVVALTGELAAIDLQVVRGTTSHFNLSTPFDGAVYSGMGLLITLVFTATVIAGVLALRVREVDRGTIAGIRWGLAVSALGMLLAVPMLGNMAWQPGGGHTVGAADGGPGMPVTDWSLLHGDLRVGHFVGLHGLQVLPLLALVLARWTPFEARTRARLTAVAGVGYGALALLATAQALRGQPLLRPDALTLAVAALIAVGTAAVAVAVCRTASRNGAAGASAFTEPERSPNLNRRGVPRR